MKPILTLMGCLAMAGCQATTRTTGIADVCLIWGEQSYSANGDTAMTVDEIRSRNAKRNAYCKGK